MTQEATTEVAEKPTTQSRQRKKPQDKQEAEKPEYVPAKGTENLVHLSIVKGRRFDENTGQELSTPYTQTFTYGEYKNFKKKARLIGYTIVKELYNPYKDL